MMAFIGVRISWLMLARKTDFIRLASSARSVAWRRSSVMATRENVRSRTCTSRFSRSASRADCAWSRSALACRKAKTAAAMPPISSRGFWARVSTWWKSLSFNAPTLRLTNCRRAPANSARRAAIRRAMKNQMTMPPNEPKATTV